MRRASLSEHNLDDDTDGAPTFPSGLALRRLLPLAGGTLSYLPIAFLLLALLAGIQVWLPQLVKAAIDGPLAGIGTVSSAEALDQLQALSNLFLGLLVFGFIVDYAAALLLHRFGQTLVLNLRLALFSKLHRLPVAYFDKNAAGRVVSRVVNDSNALSEMFSSVLAPGLGDLLLLTAIFATLLTTDPQLGLTLLWFLPALLGLVAWFRKASSPLYKVQRRLLAIINGFLGEVLEGLSTVKSFGGANFLRTRFDKLNRECYDNEVALIHKISIFRPMFYVAQTLATGILLTLGGIGVLQGKMSLGTLVSSLLYVRLLFSPLEELAERYNILLRASVASGRVLELLDLREEPTGKTEPAHRQTIEFEHVSYHYSPDKPVLKDVSFSIGPGETVALVGPTGSGKSTIISLLLGFYQLDPQLKHQGEIRYAGVPFEQLDLNLWRRRMAFVSQDLFLFKASVAMNIGLYESFEDDRIQAAVEGSGVSKLLSELPEGLSTVVGEKGHTLSTGQRQLLSFARALAFDPEFLILDEATANIDSETEAQLEQVLDRLLEGRQAVIVAHRLATVRRANTILVLSEGQIVERGSHDSLMALGGLYSEMVRKAESLHRDR